jgi:hypothetical protein
LWAPHFSAWRLGWRSLEGLPYQRAPRASVLRGGMKLYCLLSAAERPDWYQSAHVQPARQRRPRFSPTPCAGTPHQPQHRHRLSGLSASRSHAERQVQGPKYRSTVSRRHEFSGSPKVTRSMNSADPNLVPRPRATPAAPSRVPPWPTGSPRVLGESAIEEIHALLISP